MQLTQDQLASTVSDADEAAVRDAALATDYAATELEEAALRVTRVLLYRWPGWTRPFADFPNVTDTAFERWIDECRAATPVHASALVQWITGVRGGVVNYPVFLYNRDFGRTRELMRRLLTAERAPPPYLLLVFLHLFRQALGKTHTEISQLVVGPFRRVAQLFHRLFTTDAVDHWLATKRQPLVYYGGQTNTVLGAYDEICGDPTTGFPTLARDAEIAYDIGGGFATSELERLVGRPMVSADIRSPRPADYDGDLIVRHYAPGRLSIADDATRDAFLARQDRVGYLPFNVFQDSFPPDARSYLIISTGFLTSTIPAGRGAKSQAIVAAGLGPMATTVHGVARVLELVARGKDVDLFTIQRASGRVYKYKTCLLAWRGGRLTRLVTRDDAAQAQRWSDGTLEAIRAAIQPDNPRFVRHLPRPSPAPG